MIHNELTGANRALWNLWADAHFDSEFYDVEGFVEGRDTLDTVETEGVGDVTGQTLLHLQCHFGLDTLSWARRGARVVGVDFSERAIALASGLAERLDLDARFIVSDVYETLDHLDGERFDVVFTSYGAISWLPDLYPWARVIAGALKPGGRFFIAEHHPTIWMYDDETTELAPPHKYGYFDREALRWEENGSYAAPDSGITATSYSWQHTFEEIVGALVAAGLRVTSLKEYPYLAFQWFPTMVRGADGFWRMPEGAPGLPLMFSLEAVAGESG
ncbi:MAG: class I SAM-dependent methyltransferase [Coriobacteriia bacterium]